MYYLINVSNGYKFIGKYETYGEIGRLISRIKEEGKRSCFHIYSEKCKEKVLVIEKVLVTWV